MKEIKKSISRMYDAPNNNKNILLYYRWKSASAAQLECGCVSAIIVIARKLFVNAARMWGRAPACGCENVLH